MISGAPALAPPGSSPAGSSGTRTTAGSATAEAPMNTTRSPTASTEAIAVYGTSRSPTEPSGACHGQVVEPVALVGEHDPPVVQERVARLAEHPLRHADLRLHLDPGLDLAASLIRDPAVEVPPARAVGNEPQRSVRVPPGLEHRFAVARPARGTVGPAGHHHRAVELRAGGGPLDRRHHQLGAVPGHVRVVPLQPAQPGAVGREPGVGDEVGPADQRTGLELAVAVDHHHLVDHLGRARPGVVLAHDDDPPTRRVHLAVGPAIASRCVGLGHHRNGHRPPGQAIQALVLPVGEPQAVTAHPPRPAAVLVDGGAGVEPGGQQVHGRAVAELVDDLRAPPLLGAEL